MFCKINALSYDLHLTTVTVSSNIGHFILKIISVFQVVKILALENI